MIDVVKNVCPSGVLPRMRSIVRGTIRLDCSTVCALRELDEIVAGVLAVIEARPFCDIGLEAVVDRVWQGVMSLYIGGHVSALLQVAELAREIAREKPDPSLLERRDEGVRAEQAALEPCFSPEMDIRGELGGIDDDRVLPHGHFHDEPGPVDLDTAFGAQRHQKN